MYHTILLFKPPTLTTGKIAYMYMSVKIRGGSRIFLRRGCTTKEWRNGRFFCCWQNTSCITLPLDPPLKMPLSQSCHHFHAICKPLLCMCIYIQCKILLKVKFIYFYEAVFLTSVLTTGKHFHQATEYSYTLVLTKKQINSVASCLTCFAL